MITEACIIIPFFGEWPKHFSLFLDSCSKNSTVVTYLFFTDIKPPAFIPGNVKLIPLTFNEFIELATNKLETDINIMSPYKLCDYKPAYGYIFSEYIKEYNYWGHGDEDLILGDLNNFISEPIKKGYDIISFRKEWISGAFCLYKNTNKINTLFKKSKSYPNIYKDAAHLAFDECFKLWEAITKGENILKIDKKQSMTYLIKKEVLNNQIRTFFKSEIRESIPKDGYLIYRNGKIFTHKGSEFLAYHFVSDKKSFVFNIPSWRVLPDVFFIDKTGFFLKNEWNSELLRALIRSRRKIKSIFLYFMYLTKKIINKFIINLWVRK